MVTPREIRFARLAIERGILTRDQVKTLVEFETKTQTEGTSLTLWDSAVLKNMMDAGAAQEIRDDAGDLDIEKLGEFKLLRQLGRGGMGSVWLALSPDKQRVAVKVLDSSLAGQRTFVTRFFREAQASCKLKHDHIVRGLAVGESAGHYYFAMDFIEGESIGSLLSREGALPSQRAAEIILEVAEALAYAHENGTIHRDIKPDNIMLTGDGHAKLADLGLARVMHQEMTQLTATGTSMGTPLYMAPEQCQDAKNADARSDIYSLGATWYHMIAGEPPFSSASAVELMQKHMKEPVRWPTEVRNRLPKGVVLAIERMMAKAPNARIQTMKEVADTIREQCLGERDILKELGVDKAGPQEKVWYIKVQKGGQMKSVRIREGKLRRLISWSKISPDVLACPAGANELFTPISKIPALAAALPTTVPGAPPKKGKPRKIRKGGRPVEPGQKLHDAFANYEERERRSRRGKKLKKLAKTAVKFLITVAVVGAVAMAGYKYLWPRISESIESSRQPAPIEGPP